MPRVPRFLSRHPVVVGTVALLAVHLALGLTMPGPSLFADEAGYLGNARWLAAAGPLWSMGRASFFHAGYSVLLVPAVLLPGGPSVTWTAAMVTNAALLSTVFPLLYAFLRRAFNAGTGPALTGAAVGALYPAVLLQGTTAWAEAALLPLVVVALLAAHHLAGAPHLGPLSVGVGVSAGALWFVHPRTLPFALLLLGFVVLLAARRVITPLVAALNLLVGAAIALGAAVLHQRLRDARWVEVIGEPTAGRVLSALEPGNYEAVIHQVAGQAWYLLVATLGLGVVAFLWLLGVTGRPTDDGEQRARRFVAGLVVTAVVALFAVSVLTSFDTVTRLDQAVYGRYNEALFPVLVATGMTVAVSPARRRLPGGARHGTIPTLVGTALVAGTFAVVTVATAPSFETPVWAVRNVLAIGPALQDDLARTVGLATLGATVLLLALGLVTQRLPKLAGVVVGAVFLGSGVATYLTEVRPPAADAYRDWELAGVLDTVGAPRGGAYDLAFLEPFAFWGYPFWLPDTGIRPYDSSGVADLPAEPPADAELVVAPPDSPSLEDTDARLVGLDVRNGQGIWMRPGPAQDRLAAQGALLPEPWPAALPVAAARSSFAVGGDGGRIPADAGARVTTLELAVTHDGSAAPWPDVASAGPGPSGAVSLTLSWAPQGGLPVLQQRVPLPAWVLPGDTVDVALPLYPADAAGDPLPTGVYEVTVGLEQEGFLRFSDVGDDDLVLDVGVGVP